MNLEKLKNLKTWQKVTGVIAIVAVIVLIGLGIGHLTSKDKMVDVSQSEFEKLIDNEYSISDFKASDTEIDMNIKMNTIGEDDLLKLSKSIYDKAKNNGWSQSKIKMNVFTGEPKSDFTFYTDGLYGTVLIDAEKQVSDIGKFVDVPSINKATAEEIANIENEIVTNNDGNVEIALDMQIENSEAEAMKQSLAYTDVIRTINKDVTSVDLKINPNSDKSYETHTDFDKVIKSVDRFNLSE